MPGHRKLARRRRTCWIDGGGGPVSQRLHVQHSLAALSPLIKANELRPGTPRRLRAPRRHGDDNDGKDNGCREAGDPTRVIVIRNRVPANRISDTVVLIVES
ncbi:Hypothetical protein SMAX5B_001120 [Scophthalmus maximus]|uniref:Uncharacterized protein n=1 Tax=Scophthalmus maximus TaxID=52904 RepID=A0A2U9CBC7_SCOMX|nr:Hypothetical protein SMAX5B_001120 [Scophthalmus maximus]